MSAERDAAQRDRDATAGRPVALPDWHPKPTGSGLWIQQNGNARMFCANEHLQLWRIEDGPWFGPIPRPLEHPEAQQEQRTMATTADDKLNSARKHVREAFEDLKEIVVNRVNGSDNFTDYATRSFKESLAQLLEVNEKLH